MTVLQKLAQFICSIDQEYELPSISNYTIAIQTMDEVYGQYPKSFASSIDQLITLTQNILQEVHNIQMVEKTMLLDFVVNTVQEFPRLLKKKKHRLTKLFKIALDMMTQVAQEVDNNWLCPPPGFNPEETLADDEDSNARAVMSKVDQLAEVVGFPETLLHLQPLFLQYIQNTSSWKYPYAALLISSQIAIEEASIESLTLFVQWAFKETQHKHPKVRYAALHLLGQFSDDLKPEFQETYYQSFIEFTTKLLLDPVSRVVAHTFACATNFFQECKDLWKIENCLGHYLNPIVNSIKNGNTWEKENAISILSSFAMTEDAFGPNLPNIFDLSFQIINNFSTQPPYKQVINQTFELLSMLLAYQKKSYVLNYLKQTVSLLFAQKDNISKEYFLQAWNRLCKEHEDLTDLTVTYPILLQLVESMKNSHSDEECAQGLKSLSATFECYKVKAAPFAEQTIQKAMAIYGNQMYSVKFREQAMILMQTAITATKPSSGEALTNWYSAAYMLLSYICNKINSCLVEENTLWQEPDIGDIPFLFPTLKELVESISPLLSSAYLIALAQKVIEFTMRIEKHYNQACQIKQNLEEGEGDADEVESNQGALQGADDTIDDLDTAIDVIPDIVKSLIGAAAEPTTKKALVEMVQTEIERAIGKDNFMILYALNMSVSMVQTLSYQEIVHSFAKLVEIYLHFAEHSQSRIRNGGIYGLNLLLQKAPKGIFAKEQITHFLQKLSDAFTRPFENEKEKFYVNHCKDNIISTLGNLLKCYSADFPDVLNSAVFGYWFANLPLNVDKIEGNVQQEFLIEVLSSHPELVVKDVNGLKQVCQIYAKFVMKRKDKQYSEVLAKTRSSLLEIKEWPLFKESTEYLWTSLSHSQQSALTQLING